MIKKLLLTLILVVMVIGQASAEQRFVILSSTIDYVPRIKTDVVTQIRKDTKTGQEYIVIISGYHGGVAITPLIKPAVYVHKGGKR